MKRISRSFAKALKKCALITLEVLAVIAVLLILAGSATLWRLASGPINLDFAKDFIEDALKDAESGLSLSVERVALQWPEVSKPVILGLKDVRVIEENTKDIVSVDELGLSFSLSALIAGKIRPQSIYMHKPSLRLVRTEGGIQLVTGDLLSGSNDEESPGIDGILETVRIWARGQDEQEGMFSELGLLEIEDASIMVEDHVIGFSWFLPKANFSIGRSEEGAHARALVQVPGGIKTASVKASLNYLLETNSFEAGLVLEDFDPEFLSRKLESLSFLGDHNLTLSAKIEAEFDSGLKPKGIRLAVLSEEGALHLPQLYDEPLAFDSVRLAASYQVATRQVEIPQLSVRLGGLDLQASSSFAFAPGEAVTLPLKLVVPALPVDTLHDLFPPKLADTGAYRWLVQRMEGGRFSDIEVTAALDIPADLKNFDVKDGLINFAFDGVKVDYRSPMMPAENSTGTGVLDFEADTLKINGAAQIKDLQATGVQVNFDGLMVAGAGTVDIAADLNGPFSTILAYLAEEPIEYGGDLGIKPEEAKGTAGLHVSVAFPTTKDLKKEQVKIAATGTLDDVYLPGIVDGLDLKGGPFAVNVREEDFTVEGSGQLAGRNVTFNWQQYLDSEGKAYSSKVEATIGADKALREHFNIFLDEYISGTLPVDLVYKMRMNAANTVDITADLTPVLVAFKPLDYVKPVLVPGKGSLHVVLDGGNLVEVNGLTLKSSDLTLTNGRFQFGLVQGARDVSQATIDRLQMGSNDFALEVEREASGLMKLQVNGKVLDARPFLRGGSKAKSGEAAAKEPPMILSVDVLRMRTLEEEYVRNTKMYIATDNEGDITQLEMDALAGEGKVYLRYKPDAQSGRKEFHLKASDAGAALKAFGINKDVKGGELMVYGQPSGSSIRGGDIAGTAELTNFTVVNAPGLARLLSAMSLPGLAQLLNNEGMAFSKLQASFDWFTRPQGAVLVLREGRTSGNSLGLTFDGVVDRATGKIDLSGTIVPLSMVNSLIGGIPLIGDILAGGAGGAVFAATYTVKGPLKEPEISVNPLAALAPGILRRILFEGG